MPEMILKHRKSDSPLPFPNSKFTPKDEFARLSIVSNIERVKKSSASLDPEDMSDTQRKPSILVSN